MLYLCLNSIPLRLPADATAQVEHLNNLFTDGLQDSFSLPFNLPAQGNEIALQHVHELPLSRRNLQFPNAEMGHNGVPLHTGVLRVLSAGEQEVQASFSLEGFVQEIKGKMLPDCIAAERIDLTDELVNQSISLSIRPLYEEGGKCQFPMYRNKDMYGDANPDWYPSEPEWDASNAYTINDRVTYTEHQSGILRTDIWTCIDAGGTIAGESPESHPAKWRRNAFGVVNAWDRSTNQHHYNTTDGNFYCFVPWFYLKWVLRRALAHVGYTPVGSFMDDSATHELVLPNNSTIDTAIAADSALYYQVANSTAQHYDPDLAANQFILQADTESPVPLQDTNGLWDPTTGTFTPDTAGTWVFRVTLDTVNMPDFGQVFNQPWGAVGRIMLHRAGVLFAPDPNANVGVFYVYPGQTSFFAQFAVPFGAGDINVPYELRLDISQPLGSTFPYNASHAIRNVTIVGFLQNPAPTVCIPETTVTPSRHVPEVELSAFINAIADAFNLELRPYSSTRTLRMDYKEPMLLAPEQHTTQHDARLVNNVQLDFQRSIPGMRLRWDVETHNEDERNLANAQQSFSELGLPVPHTTGQKLVIISTRALYKSVFRYGYFAWEHVGYHVPSVLVGNAEGAREVCPAMKPVHMVHEQLDGKQYIIPELNATGTSGWFHTEGDRGTIWICEFKRQKSSDGTVTDVPGARSWGWGWDATDASRTTLLWNQPMDAMPGTYQRCWQRWLAMLTTAEPVTLDLLVDNNFLKSDDWRRILHMHGQDYLIESLPMTYGNSRGQLISEGVYAYRLRPPGPSVLRVDPPTGDAMMFFTGSTGYMEFYTTTGYVTLRDEFGVQTTYISDDGPSTYISIDIDDGTPRWWNAWSSDAFGNPVGYITILSVFSVLVLEMNLGSQPMLLYFDVTAQPITQLDVSGCPALTTLLLAGCAIADSDAVFNQLNSTISGGTASLSGGTNAPVTSASAAARAALLASGWNLLYNP
jgi:hypothetical protein